MNSFPLDDTLILATKESLAVQKPDGSISNEAWSTMTIHCWALAYTLDIKNNPYFKNPDLLSAIETLGQYNYQSFNNKTGFTNNISEGWDEWRLYAWMEATELIKNELDQQLLAQWQDCFLDFANHIMALCLHMDTFDGAIPNHGIWGHSTLYRLGQILDRSDFMDMADHAFERIFTSQTLDGCFREGGTFGGIQGTPVTGYNTVSLLAINMYYGHSSNAKALKALELGWDWWYGYLFPDLSSPPALDCRGNGHHKQTKGRSSTALCIPAHFLNKPEIRKIITAQWQHRRPAESTRFHTGPYNCQGLGFITLQYDKIDKTGPELDMSWPEYKRMKQEEACIRRRHAWHVVLSGISNASASHHTFPVWRSERQVLVNVYHEKLGLLVGSTNSVIQEDISTFSFYENGAAYYLHNHAYLKSTPSLDTLLLQYGNNTGAVSVDSNQVKRCQITFSVHGETGKNPKPGNGFPMSAIAAKGRLSLNLQKNNQLTIDNETIFLKDTPVVLSVKAGQKVQFEGWSIESKDSDWEFRWPVFTRSPYSPLQPYDTTAVVECVLFNESTSLPAHPTASFIVDIN